MWDTICAIWTKVRQVCCFTSILATVGMGIAFFGPKDMMTFAGVLYFIGMLSAIIACFVKLLSTVGFFVSVGFTYGFFFLVIGCVIGAALGLILALTIITIAPAIITIRYFIDMWGIW